jgi:hypothetical protein
MMRYLSIGAVAGVFGLLVGCKPPLHLTYDFGRAYIETLKVQADFTRLTVVLEAYNLYGVEGVLIRINVQTKTSTEATGSATFNLQ